MKQADSCSRRLCLPVVVLACALLALTGCGRKGTISGKVSVNGEAMPGGSITFVPADPSKSQRGGINDDGTYRVEGVPSGPAKVVVTPRKAPNMGGGGPQPMGAGRPPVVPGGGAPPGGKAASPAEKMQLPPGVQLPPEAAKRFEAARGSGKTVSIPEDYQDSGKTPLTYEVKGGSQTKDFDIPTGK